MCARHFAKRHSDCESDACAYDVAEDDCRPSNFDGGSRTKQQTSANGASDREHSELTGSKLVSQAGFATDLPKICLRRHLSEMMDRVGKRPKT